MIGRITRPDLTKTRDEKKVTSQFFSEQFTCLLLAAAVVEEVKGGGGRREESVIMSAFTHTNDSHLRSMLEILRCAADSTKYRADSARKEGSCQRSLASSFLASSSRVDRTMTDDRNNWIAGSVLNMCISRGQDDNRAIVA